jgi:hypothetical protein
MGDYKGAGVESGKMGYYFSTVAGNGLYTQGAMQTVQQSASGIDPRTGRTITGTTAGVIHGKYLSIIAQRLRNHQRGPEEALLPIYNAQGQIVAYERHMAPKALAALQRNTHMGEMLGAWAGRQAEEELGQEFNHKLVDNLKTIWEKAKTEGRTGEFVDLSDETLKDEIYLDSWKMVPGDLRVYIEQAFGGDGFPIRKDMINNAVGYRAASITDPWTGISRMDDKHQEGFVKMATVLLGRDAFTKLATAEKAIQAGVSVVKSTIVVRSIIIPITAAPHSPKTPITPVSRCLAKSLSNVCRTTATRQDEYRAAARLTGRRLTRLVGAVRSPWGPRPEIVMPGAPFRVAR